MLNKVSIMKQQAIALKKQAIACCSGTGGATCDEESSEYF